MVGFTANAVVAKASCSNSPVIVNVAASDDIAPAIQAVANSFNKQNVTNAGHCVDVQVDQQASATEAAQIDGQAKSAGGAAVDAWIPDSSLWVDETRMFPVGAQAVQQTGKSVARSPLMLVTTPAVAKATGIFDAPPSWNLLLPSAVGGPPASDDITVDLPDPTTSSSGLASLIQVSRELGNGAAARTAVTDFALGVTDTEDFDSPSALASFVQTTEYPFDRKAITVASEQAVLAYDKANPKSMLDAVYPTSANSALGTLELNYPYVLTTTRTAELRAARQFGNYLQTSYAQSVMRYYGFRSTNGMSDTLPASTGLAKQPLQLGSAVSPTEAANNLQVWQKLGLGFRDLVLVDVSPAMGQPSGLKNLTVQQVVSETAAQGLGLFPDSAEMGVWEMGKSSSVNDPYTQLVPIGSVSANYGLITRRAQIQQILETTTTSSTGVLALHDAILDAYKAMTKTYAPNYSNAIIVLTSGVDTARADMSLSSLVSELQHLYNPAKKVEIVILMFGPASNFPAMQKIADATGGEAFQVTNPSEVGQIFIEGVSLRMCNQGCVTP